MPISSVEDLAREFRSSAAERRLNARKTDIGGRIFESGHTRIGRIYRVQSELPEIDRTTFDDLPDENRLEMFKGAIEATKEELERVKNISSQSDQPSEIRSQLPSLMDVHLTLLKKLESGSLNKFVGQTNMLDAIFSATAEQIEALKREKTMSYLSDDFTAVRDRLVRNVLLKSGMEIPRSSLENAEHGFIVFADKICPSDIIYIQWKGIRGLVIREGSPSGHVAALANELAIPCLFIDEDFGAIHDDMPVIVDQENGLVILSPTEDTIISYEYAVEREVQKARLREALRGKKIQTQCGESCNVYANITASITAQRANRNAADGVGLFRTEFLFTGNNEEPSIEAQANIYAAVIEAVEGHSTTIRLLDVEGDKNEGGWIKNADLDRLRENQIESILLASSKTGHPANILVPVVRNEQYLLSIREITQAKILELKASGVDVLEPKIGMMIEVPAAALEFEHFVDHADFFSFGTNDLFSWMNAVRRDDPIYSKHEDSLRPANLKLMRDIIKVANEREKPISICGQIASQPFMIPVLIGLGLRKFSVGAEEVLSIKETIGKIDVRSAKSLVDGLMQERDPDVRNSRLMDYCYKNGIAQGPNIDNLQSQAVEALDCTVKG